MIRASMTILGVFCIAMVVTELLACGVLWQRGMLTAEALNDIRAALTGQPLVDPSAVAETQAAAPAMDEIKQQRAIRILELDSRETEINLLKDMTTRAASDLVAEQQAFEGKRQAFATELQALMDRQTAAATEQTRAILLALPAEEAAARLMVLPVEENVVLLTGMPEKSIASILQEFRGEADRVERGKQIFEAISRGLPASELSRKTLDDLQAGNSQAPR